MTDILGPASVGAVTTRPGRTIVRGSSNTWFIDCTSQQAADGTLCPADYFNDTLAQLRQTFTSANIVQDNADDMLWRAIQSVGIRYGVDTGTAQALKVNFVNPVLTLAVGPPPLVCLVKAAHDAAGASTFQANATSAVSLVWGDGGGVLPGDWAAGDQLLMVYNGATWDLISVGKRGAAGTSAAGGCGYLSLSGGNLVLNRLNGSNLIVNGSNMQIPSSGIILAPGGLAANNFNYIYAYSNAGIPTLAAMTTGHSKGPDGTEVCTSDASRALVGACYVVSGPAFIDQDSARYVLSWFNKSPKKSQTKLTTNVSTGSLPFVELSTAIRNAFINWGGDSVEFVTTGLAYATGGQTWAAGVNFDSSLSTTPELETAAAGTGSVGNNGYGPVAISGRKTGLSEGVTHFATVMGSVFSGPGTALFGGSSALSGPSGPSCPVTLTITTRG